MHPLKILIVDDEPDCRNSLARLLRAMGHEVWPVACGNAAGKAARLLQPALILVDIRMPDMDGYEVARRLQAIDHSAIVFSITGFATEDDKRKGKDSSFDGHLTKPIEISVLKNLMDNIASTQLTS